MARTPLRAETEKPRRLFLTLSEIEFSRYALRGKRRLSNTWFDTVDVLYELFNVRAKK